MAKEEIVEGLKAAIAKGESLNKAMMSFYNSGYSKQDVEDAAKLLDAPQLQQSQTSQPQSQPLKTTISKLPQQAQTQTSQPEIHSVPQPLNSQSPQTETQTQQFLPLQQTQSIQKVSNYGGKPNPLGAVAIFVLVFFLLVLVGVLIAVFLFKDELAGLFNGLL